MFAQWQLVPKDLRVDYNAATDLKNGYEEAANNSTSTTTTSAINSSYWQCPICQNIAREPIEMGCCKHWYCAHCFLDYITRPGVRLEQGLPLIKCAICRLYIFDSQTTNEPAKNRQLEYYALRVKCGFGCGYADEIRVMHTHERRECPRRIIKCPFPLCNESGTAFEIEAHILTCSKRAINCPNCRLPIFINEFPLHDCKKQVERALTALNSDLQSANMPVPYFCQLGFGGHLALQKGVMDDDNAPSVEYCKKFHKAPATIPERPKKSKSEKLGIRKRFRLPSVFGNKPQRIQQKKERKPRKKKATSLISVTISASTTNPSLPSTSSTSTTSATSTTSTSARAQPIEENQSQHETSSSQRPTYERQNGVIEPVLNGTLTPLSSTDESSPDDNWSIRAEQGSGDSITIEDDDEPTLPPSPVYYGPLGPVYRNLI